jgi:ribosome recycling factor
MTNMTTHDINEIKRRMQGASAVLKKELSGLRTGRASAHLLDPVMVDAYGAQMPLNQVATVSVPEPRLISVNVWDRSLVRPVEKAIVNSNLGLSPATEGQTIRLRIPELNEERRKELVKLAHKYAETARVAVRHVRRDAMDVIKSWRRSRKISKDDHERFSTEIQKATDAGIAEIDHMLAGKEKRSSRSEVALHARGRNSSDATAFDMPRHVAIIMDGNGRWAATRGLPRAEGHRRGVEALRRTVRAAGEMGIKISTIFRSVRKTGRAL